MLPVLPEMNSRNVPKQCRKDGAGGKSELSALQLRMERQRLAWRGDCHGCRLMMFDEATNNLDPATVLTIEDTARKLAKEGRPVLGSVMIPPGEAAADRVVMMVAAD